MKRCVAVLVFAFLCLAGVAAYASLAQAQGPPHGGPPPGGQGPGGPGGPGAGPGSPGSPNNGKSPGPRTQGANGVARTNGQFGPVGRWWDDKSVIQAIGLRKDQQRKMDTIFNNNKPAILENYKTFLSEQSKLDAVNKDPKADQATTFAAIDAVSKARASLQKATAQMLLQIRQEMEPDQITKLEKLP